MVQTSKTISPNGIHKRIIIKIGTSTLTNGEQRLYKPAMADIVRQCAYLHTQGYEIAICSSGAVAAGQDRLQRSRKPKNITEKQMLAAVGQSRLMLTWESLFEIYDIHVGQILLTRSDFEARNRFLNARDTLQVLIQNRIIPIINENDAVTTEEIRVGDNDNLSAQVAVLADADLLIILTDQKGLYTADPRFNPDARLITEVTSIDDNLRRLAGGAGTKLGTGGMATKLQAADVARRAGTKVVIALGNDQNIITRAVAGEDAVGTSFKALANPAKNRKRWLLTASATLGYLSVNEQAEKVIKTEKGRSLLPAGITEVGGKFGRGETVDIKNVSGDIIARGIARYTSHDLKQIIGHQSDQIESILGYAYGPVAIHHNDMVILRD